MDDDSQTAVGNEIVEAAEIHGRPPDAKDPHAFKHTSVLQKIELIHDAEGEVAVESDSNQPSMLDVDELDDGSETETEYLPPHFVDLFAGTNRPMSRALE